MEAERANMRSAWSTTRPGADGSPHAGLLPHALAQFLDAWGYWEDAAAAHRQAARSWQ